MPRGRDRPVPAVPSSRQRLDSHRARRDARPGQPGGGTDGRGMGTPSVAVASRRAGRQVRS